MQLTIYTDGGSRGNPGISGGGAVVFQDDKEIYSMSASFGIKTNNEAEYLAVIMALEWLQKFSQKQKTKQVKFFLDSKLITEQLNKTWKIKEPRLKNLAQNCWNIIGTLPYPISFLHVRREKNVEADLLANQAMDTATM
ncbi:MAG: ribonuclease HI family protein [Candidatus Paceibacterota bacterium]